MAPRVLAVIDRDCPGTEDMRDPLYFCVGVRAQFGATDLVLRGPAVASALTAAGAPPTNPQRYVWALVRAGVRVWADEADLAQHRRADQTVIDGVLTVDTDTLAARWPEYEEVWFL